VPGVITPGNGGPRLAARQENEIVQRHVGAEIIERDADLVPLGFRLARILLLVVIALASFALAWITLSSLRRLRMKVRSHK
jgi:hypothetical protein